MATRSQPAYTLVHLFTDKGVFPPSEPLGLHTIKSKDGLTKALIITKTWATNKIGSSVQIWCYKYKEKNIQKISYMDGLDIDAVENPKIMLQYLGDLKINLKLPEFNYSIIVPTNNEMIKNSGMSEKELSSATNVAYPSSITAYAVKDFDSDGFDELATQRMVYFGNRWIRIPKLTTCFKYQNGKMVPYNVKIGLDELK